MNIELQINSLIDTTLDTNRNATGREGIEQAIDRSYIMWRDIGLSLHNNFITTHLTLLSSFSVCACSYVPLVPALPDAGMLKTTLQAEMDGTVMRDGNIIIRAEYKYLGAQKLIDVIYEKYIAIITKFQGASITVSGATVDVDITLYHARIRPLLLQRVAGFINSIQHDYFNTGSDLFEKVKEFNKNLAKLLYDSSLHFIMPNDGICTIGGNPGPLLHSGAVYT